ncbi:MAG: cyclophilin-like family protein [Nitrososphaerales archaeon]
MNNHQILIDRNLNVSLINDNYYSMNSKTSVSKLSIIIEVYGKGRAEGEVFRHLAPITLNSLLRNMPLNGRAIRFKDQFVYITSGIIAGVEKARKIFQKGEIGFLSSNGALCFFLKSCEVAMPINPLGKITSGLDVLIKIGAGDVIAVNIE